MLFLLFLENLFFVSHPSTVGSGSLIAVHTCKIFFIYATVFFCNVYDIEEHRLIVMQNFGRCMTKPIRPLSFGKLNVSTKAWTTVWASACITHEHFVNQFPFTPKMRERNMLHLQSRQSHPSLITCAKKIWWFFYYLSMGKYACLNSLFPNFENSGFHMCCWTNN